jgi:hypothetical protein
VPLSRSTEHGDHPSLNDQHAFVTRRRRPVAPPSAATLPLPRHTRTVGGALRTAGATLLEVDPDYHRHARAIPDLLLNDTGFANRAAACAVLLWAARGRPPSWAAGRGRRRAGRSRASSPRLRPGLVSGGCWPTSGIPRRLACSRYVVRCWAYSRVAPIGTECRTSHPGRRLLSSTTSPWPFVLVLRFAHCLPRAERRPCSAEHWPVGRRRRSRCCAANRRRVVSRPDAPRGTGPRHRAPARGGLATGRLRPADATLFRGSASLPPVARPRAWIEDDRGHATMLAKALVFCRRGGPTTLRDARRGA